MHLRYCDNFMTKLSVIGNMIFRAEMSLLQFGGGEAYLDDSQRGFEKRFATLVQVYGKVRYNMIHVRICL